MDHLSPAQEKMYLEEITSLKDRISELEQIEKENKKNIEKLAEKEAFNFALFQFNPFYTVVVDREGKVVKSNFAKRHSKARIPNIGDVMYKDYASHHEIDMYNELMDAIKTDTLKTYKELKYGETYLSITIAPFSQGAIITSLDITEQKTVENDRIHLIAELQRALNEVETLRGLLPICAGCKKIRDDQGYWNHIELYFAKHSHLDFTHTLCPECVQHYYPEYWQKIQERRLQNQTTDQAKSR